HTGGYTSALGVGGLGAVLGYPAAAGWGQSAPGPWGRRDWPPAAPTPGARNAGAQYRLSGAGKEPRADAAFGWPWLLPAQEHGVLTWAACARYGRGDRGQAATAADASGVSASMRPSTRQEASCERKFIPGTSIVPSAGATTTVRLRASILPRRSCS